MPALDLKNLLLHSLASAELITRQRRVHFGNKCYQITYEVKGKWLTLKRIKRAAKRRRPAAAAERRRRARRRRRRQRLPLLPLYERHRFVAQPPPSTVLLCTSDSEPRIGGRELRNSEAQTLRTPVASKATETEPLNVLCREQQTVQKYVRRQSTQTQPCSGTQAVQTEHLGRSRACQTVAVPTKQTASMWVQAVVDMCGRAAQTAVWDGDGMGSGDGEAAAPEPTATPSATTQPAAAGEVEEMAVVFMLNEIGEMIINQNNLLHNNCTLLNQLAEVGALRGVAQHEREQLGCRLQREERRRERRWRQRGLLCRRCRSGSIRQQSYRNESVQTLTPLPSCDGVTQTGDDRVKQKRSLFKFKFKKF